MLSNDRKIDYNKFINSAIGTFIAEIVTQPVCITRTRLINTNNYIVDGKIVNGITTKIIKQLYLDQGILGFYRASTPAVLSQMLSTSLKYGIYSNLHTESFFEKIRNGILSGIFVVTVTNPIDVVKVNMQMGVVGIINQPFSFFYRGYDHALYKAIIGGALYFPLKEKLQEFTGNNVIASISSAIIAVTICQPIDWAKTRLMNGKTITTTCHHFSNGNVTNRIKIFLNNLRISYTGYTLCLARIVPSFTITMVVSDYLNGMKKF